MTQPPTTIHFVRHGLVENPRQIFYGRLPRFGLSAEGWRQAGALTPFFKARPLAAIFSSPLLRARQTAAAIATASGFSGVKISQTLIECHTPYDGHPISELDARNWDLYTGTLAPYEQPEDVFRRTYTFIERVLRRYPGREVAAVTHADVVVFLALWAHGYPVDFAHKSLIEHKQIAIKFPAPASVTSLTWTPGTGRPQFTYYENPRKEENGK